MYIKILSQHGQGSVQNSIDYYTSEHDHKGRERQTEPVVLHGDAERLRQVCDNIDHQNKFVTGGMFFEEELNNEQMETHIREFCEDRFPGMDTDNVEMMWVAHDDHVRTELNFIIAKVDLETGKAMNPFPPNWQDDFDHWRDMINEKYDYSRPDDLKKDYQSDLDYRLEKFSDKFKEKHMKRKEIVKEVTEFVIEEFAEDFQIPSRDDVIEALGFLEEAGIKVEKESEKYIAISAEGHDKNIRLKGNFYDNRNYNKDGYSFENSSLKDRPSEEREREFREDCEHVNRSRERRAAYNAERFGASEPIAFIDVEREVSAYRENQLGQRHEIEHNAGNEHQLEQSNRVDNERANEIEEPQYRVDESEHNNEQSASTMESSSRANQPVSSNASDLTHVELDQSSFVGTGHENESALTKANRFQRWFDEAKKQEKKLNRAMDNARQKIKRLKNETAKTISSIAEDFFTFAGRLIPSFGRINNESNQRNNHIEQLKQRANELTVRTRKANELHREREQAHETAASNNTAIDQRYEQALGRILEQVEAGATAKRELRELDRQQEQRVEIDRAISVVGTIRQNIIGANLDVRELEKAALAKKQQVRDSDNKRKKEHEGTHVSRLERYLERENWTDEQFFESLPEQQKKWYFDPAKEFSKIPDLDKKQCPSCLKIDCKCGIKVNYKNKKK